MRGAGDAAQAVAVLGEREKEVSGTALQNLYGVRVPKVTVPIR